MKLILFYLCINLIITWAVGPLWGLFSEEWWIFGFGKFISKHGSILEVNRESPAFAAPVVATVTPMSPNTCKRNKSHIIKQIKGQVI